MQCDTNFTTGNESCHVSNAVPRLDRSATSSKNSDRIAILYTACLVYMSAIIAQKGLPKQAVGLYQCLTVEELCLAHQGLQTWKVAGSPASCAVLAEWQQAIDFTCAGQ